jgi:hypothetical protein
MSITKTEIKIEKRLGDLLVYLASDALQIEYEREDEGESDFAIADLDAVGAILNKLERMVDADAVSLLGSIVAGVS